MTTQPTAPLTRPTKTSPACKDDVIADYCVCCFGDPELVCAACGEHSCWAGYYLCWESGPAGVVTRAEFEKGEGER
jgi:hypothetical protein